MILVRAVALPLLSLLLMVGLPSLTSAQTADQLKNQIDDRNQQIKDLQSEISKYQKQVDELGAQKNTLQLTINSLALSQKQLTAQIALTQKNIETSNAKLATLSGAIGDKEITIGKNQGSIAKALRVVAEREGTSLMAQLLTKDSLVETWQMTEEIAQFNEGLAASIKELHIAREELSQNRDAVARTKEQLLALQTDLTLQKKSVDASKKAEQQLLHDTKNQESAYQKLIAQKKAAEQAFEQELASLQGQLELIVNPGSLPKVGTGVITWPFSTTFMQNCSARQKVFKNIFCITQFFGTTPFATANPQVYNGGGHNAIDMGAPIGTPVSAALTGTVIGTGNTDLVRGCYSFGKWVMVDHRNGLSTLYAHLSSVHVTTGQTVTIRQVIGLSGMTGYATGPHLHFSVYATEGLKIATLSSFRGSSASPCAGAIMPVATKAAYLNPLSYL